MKTLIAVLGLLTISSTAFAGGLGCTGVTKNGNKVQLSVGFNETNPADPRIDGAKLFINGQETESRLLKGDQFDELAVSSKKNNLVVYLGVGDRALALNTKTKAVTTLQCSGD